MANGGRIDFTVGYKLDKTGINQIKKELNDLSSLGAKDVLNLNPNLSNVNQAKSALQTLRLDIEKINQAYETSFDSTTGVANIQKLNGELKKIGLTKLQQDFSQLGAVGQKSFTRIASSVLTTNVKLKESKNIIDKMGQTLMNTLKWSVSSSMINTFAGSIQRAWGYVQHLDTSLNDIRIVTGKSADEMDKFAIKANKAAQSLGAATTDYTEAALIYYQQGLSDEESQARAETTLKAANVTGQTGREVSEQLTAVWNGYKVTAEETEMYVDKLAAVAATTASDLEELSTGMSKVASAANNMGVDVDQLNAQLATIISVTRQAPETAGTALKTIYARLEDLKISGEDEEGVKLGEVSSTLDELGIHVMDAEGNLRDLGEVIEEVAAKWDTWTDAQQSAAAQAMAGKRQYNNLLALFDNWDIYTSALETSRNSLGTLQEQQDIYMESTAAHLQQLETEWEDFYDSMFDSKSMNSLIDLGTDVLSMFTKLLDAIGGGKGLLVSFGAVFTRVFSKTIGQNIGNIVNNFRNLNENARIYKNLVSNIKDWSQEFKFGMDSQPVEKMLQIQQQIVNVWDLMTDAEKEASQEIVKQIGLLENEKIEIIQSQEALNKFLETSAKQDIKALQQKDFLSSDLTKGGVSETQRSAVIKEIDKEQEEIQKLNEAYKALQLTRNKAASTRDKTEKIDNYQAAIDQILEMEKHLKSLERLNLPDEEVEKFKKAIEKAKVAANNLKNGSVDGVNDALKKVLSLGEDVLAKAGVDVENLRKAASGAKEALDEVQEKEDLLVENLKLKEFNTDKLVQGFSSLASSLMSAAAMATNLKNIFSVWDEEDLSIGERLSQSLLSAISAISMMGMVLTGLKRGLVEVGVATGAFTAIQDAEKLTLIQTTVALLANKLGIEGVENATAKYNTKLLLTKIALKLFKTETLKNAVANAENTLALEGEAAAAEFLNAALLPIAGILAGITVAIGTVIGVIAYSIHQHEKEIEKIRETNEAIRENNKIRNEELEKNKELANSFEELVDKYKEGTISQEEFYNQKAQLLMAMDEEARIALNTADNWREAQEALSNYRAEVAKQQKEIAEENTESYFEDVLTAGDTGFGSYDTKTGIFTNEFTVTEQNKKTIDTLRQYMQEQGLNLDDIGTLVQKTLPDGTTTSTFKISIDKTQDLDAFLGFIDAVKTVQKEGIYDIPDIIWNDVQEFTKDENFNQLKTEKQEIDTKTVEEAGHASGIDVATNIEQGKEAYEKFKDQLVKDEGYTLDQAQKAWTTYLSGLNTEVAQQMSQTEADFTQMTHDIYKGDINASLYGKRAREILEQLENLGISEGVHLIGSDEWKEMLLSGTDINIIIQRIREELQKNLAENFKDFKANLSPVTDSMQELISQDIEGKIDLSDKGVYQGLKENVEKLLEYYPQLFEQARIFNNEALIGTEKWTQSVYDLQAAFDSLELDNLINNYSSSLQQLHEQQARETAVYDDKGFVKGAEQTVYDDRGFATTVVLEPDTQQFTETVEDIMSADYAINMEIHADITDDFDNLVNSMENMDKMATKIGEDFIVSAEDITEIAETYPGILEGYTDLGNGTIQLNEEIARSAMNAASEAEIASTEELKNEIENTNKKLRVKQNHYKTIVELATKGAQDEANAEQYKTDIATELNEIETINNDLKTQEIVDNALSVADDSAKNAEIVSNNWEDAYQNMADASEEAARIAIKNAKAVVAANKGEDASAVHGNIKTNWSGEQGNKTTIDTTTPQFEQKTDESNKDYFNRIKEAAQDNIDALDKEIAANEAMKIEAVARLGKSVKTNSDVGKPKEDSSSKSSSEKEAKHEDHLEREADLYRNINSELKQIESTLGRIQKENNYKWGKDLQEGLKRENKLLDQQLAKLQEKSKIQQKDLATRRAQFEAQGYQFSEDGSTITNAEAKLDVLYASYNAMIDNYNSMSADQQEEYKKQLDEEKKNIDKIEKGLKDYESLFSDYQGTLDSILDLHYQQIENAVSRFNNMVDVHLELDNARKEWNDFWYEVVEDAENLNFGTNIDYFEKKIEQSMGKLSTLLGIGGNAKDSEISTLTKHLNETVTQVEAQIASKNRGGEDSLFEDATKLSKENLETYREKLMSTLREAKEEVNNIAENYLNLLDTAQKKIDKQIDGWESISNHIEHNLELIKLVSGEKAFEPLLKQYDKLYEINLKTVEAQKTGQDYWADQIKKYEKLLETTEEGTVQWKTYSEALEKASENYKKSVEGLDKSVEKALKDLEEWRKTQVESILDTLDKAMTHGAGLEFVKEEWNLINEYSSRYLDNVERAVETELYTNDLEKAANATGITAKNQERINKFREEELKKLKEKEKLSQYDIDESRARLNILQQEIALEEARNNKSNMRLRRDSQGNYTYQYTGDEAAQDEAENGLLTAKKEWYELVKNRHKETTDWIIEDTQRYYDYIKKADEERAKGNEEGYKNYMNLAQEAYKAIEDDAAEMNKNAQDLLSGTAQFFADIKDASILPTSKAMAASMNKDIGTIKEAGEKAVNALTATQEKFGEKTKKILEQAGINYENLTEKGIDPTQDALEDLNGTNEELEQSLEEVNKVLEEQESLLAEAEEAYNNFKDAAVEALEAAQRAWEELAKTVIESQHQIQAEIQTTQQMQQQSNATSPSAFRSTRDSNGSGEGGDSSEKYTLGARQERSDPGEFGLYRIENDGSKTWIEDGTPEILKKKYKNQGYSVQGLATGGYTGDWNGSDGRLAVLHQKELVLNESDTSNLLKAIAVLRQVVTSMNFSGIADSLVSSTAQWMNKAATQPLTAGNISNISSVNNDTNNNYKNVTVNADFSGVQSAEAIYQALTELENYGMQESYSVAPYANKSY